MKRRTPEDRFTYIIRKQLKKLEEFVEHETEWANDLIYWFSLKKQDIPDDEYRACAFFINKEYLHKPKSLTLLYEMYLCCHKEFPQVTKENAFDLLRFQFKMYAKVLEKGGF